MKRITLYLPVYLLGLPLLVCLLLASAATEEPQVADKEEDRRAPAADDESALPSAAQFEKLARTDPVAFLESCIRRYQREVAGYSLTMQKQERIDGKLYPVEVAEVHFREKPHSVCMIWREGARNAERVLYVEGENNGKLLARPNGTFARRIAGDVVERSVAGPEARQSGRFTLNHYGLKKSIERTYDAWKAAKGKDKLQVEYLGEQKIKEVDNRPCYVLRRTYAAPEQDGVVELTTSIDKETWLQVGSILYGDGKNPRPLIGEYYFRDIKLNPPFQDNQFKREALIP